MSGVSKQEAERLFATVLKDVEWNAKQVAEKHNPCPQLLDEQDFIQTGMIAVYRFATEKFNPELGLDFRGLVQLRIRGAMVDLIRSTTSSIWKRNGSRKIKIANVGSIDRLHRQRHDITKPMSLSEMRESRGRMEPSREEFAGLVRELVPGTDSMTIDALALYYFDDITMKETGEKLGISESRVSQKFSEFAKQAVENRNQTNSIR